VVVGPINPGQTINVGFTLTITTWFNEIHRLVATIDPENAVAESNEGDNVRIVEYVLQQGGCA
jgi:subtilase family serine protease